MYLFAKFPLGDGDISKKMTQNKNKSYILRKVALAYALYLLLYCVIFKWLFLGGFLCIKKQLMRIVQSFTNHDAA